MRNDKYVYWYWQLARCEEMETCTLTVEVQVVIIAKQVNLSALIEAEKAYISWLSSSIFRYFPRETHTSEQYSDSCTMFSSKNKKLICFSSRLNKWTMVIHS